MSDTAYVYLQIMVDRNLVPNPGRTGENIITFVNHLKGVHEVKYHDLQSFSCWARRFRDELDSLIKEFEKDSKEKA